MTLYGRHPASLAWAGAPCTTGGQPGRNVPLCRSCGRAIRTGEAHWAGHGDQNPWHYGCAERAGLTWPWSAQPATPGQRSRLGK
ncbi:hypothetical protein [Azospirillum sp. TSO35-2]|uniref:hypothetical protein n=1 Tax=Azospirillum sp. TSO35-2 TaxID=716796 RepID=UPI0011B475D6|nr:hypothetical protein [Azospirillum sp. TSO35-2]